MPNMKGPELADRLRARLPDLKVLYQTGFSDQLFEERTELGEGEQFLEKPFRRRACAKRRGWRCTDALIRKDHPASHDDRLNRVRSVRC
jgi:CheY-like chemotaxis protein